MKSARVEPIGTAGGGDIASQPLTPAKSNSSSRQPRSSGIAILSPVSVMLGSREPRDMKALLRDKMVRTKLLGRGSSSSEEDLNPKRGRQCLVYPGTTYKRTWDFIYGILLMQITLRAPFNIAFSTIPQEGEPWWWFDLFVDLFYLADLVQRFFTPFTVDGELVTSLKGICFHYVTRWFFVDALASVPFTLLQLFVEGDYFRVFQLLRLLRWVKFISLTGVEEFFGSVFNLGFRGRNILKMVKLVFYISISAHIGGCLWFYMAAINNFGTNTWTHAYGVNNSSILSKYLSSVYWAFATVTTVGYGDVHAISNEERGLALALIALGGFVFALVVGRMSTLSQDVMNVVEINYQKRLGVVETLNEFRNVPRALRMKIRDFYTMMYQETLYSHQERTHEELPSSLQRSLLLHTYQDVLESLPMLLFGSNALRYAVLRRFQQQFVLENDWILLRGDIVETSYFIRKGGASFVCQDTGRAMASVEMGASFGLHWMVAPLTEADLLAQRLKTKRATDPTRLPVLTGEQLAADQRNIEDEVFQWSFPDLNIDIDNALICPTRSPPMGWDPAHCTEADIEKLRNATRKSQHSTVYFPRRAPCAVHADADGELLCLTREDLIELSAEFPGLLTNILNIEKVRSEYGRLTDQGSTLYSPPHPYRSWTEMEVRADGSQDLAIYVEGLRSTSRKLQAARYIPRPIDLASVRLNPELRSLVELIARNNHELWASKRMEQGWRHGTRVNDSSKLHPDLVEFDKLPEESQQLNRDFPEQLLKTIVYLGFDILPDPLRFDEEIARSLNMGDSPQQAPPLLASVDNVEESEAKEGGNQQGSLRPQISIGAIARVLQVVRQPARVRRRRTPGKDIVRGKSHSPTRSRRRYRHSKGLLKAITQSDRFVAMRKAHSGRGQQGSPDTFISSPDSSFGYSNSRRARSEEPRAKRTLTDVLHSANVYVPFVRTMVANEIIHEHSEVFAPQPIEVDDVKLPPEFDALVEPLSVQAHEVWAKRRIEQGWRWGYRRDNRLKKHRCLIPYESLSLEEKSLVRESCEEVLKLLLKLGFMFVKRLKDGRVRRLSLETESKAPEGTKKPTSAQQPETPVETSTETFKKQLKRLHTMSVNQAAQVKGRVLSGAEAIPGQVEEAPAAANEPDAQELRQPSPHRAPSDDGGHEVDKVAAILQNSDSTQVDRSHVTPSVSLEQDSKQSILSGASKPPRASLRGHRHSVGFEKLHNDDSARSRGEDHNDAMPAPSQLVLRSPGENEAVFLRQDESASEGESSDSSYTSSEEEHDGHDGLTSYRSSGSLLANYTAMRFPKQVGRIEVEPQAHETGASKARIRRLEERVTVLQKGMEKLLLMVSDIHRAMVDKQPASTSSSLTIHEE